MSPPEPNKRKSGSWLGRGLLSTEEHKTVISTFREFSKRGRITLDRRSGFAVHATSMEESTYRESRLCRLLGNPVVYQFVVLLRDVGALTPSKLAKLAGRSVQTVSGHLAKLKAADVVRYDSKGREVLTG